MIKLGDYVVTPTIFPDGTSQVWHIPQDVLENADVVTWDFENEAELSHVLQLSALFTETRGILPSLYMPYLIYGRQDKPISNNSTFARNVIIPVLDKFFSKITTLDAHSQDYIIFNTKPSLSEVLLEVKPNIICYPDKGASQRGYLVKDYPTIILDKKRNQSTGEIEGLQFLPKKGINHKFILNDSNILIVDDICDGGRTFIEAAKLLKGMGAKSVCLYTTHGIYSKGVKVILDGGIDRIFNYKGEVKDGN